MQLATFFPGLFIFLFLVECLTPSFSPFFKLLIPLRWEKTLNTTWENSQLPHLHERQMSRKYFTLETYTGTNGTVQKGVGVRQTRNENDAYFETKIEMKSYSESYTYRAYIPRIFTTAKWRFGSMGTSSSVSSCNRRNNMHIKHTPERNKAHR